MTQKDRTTEVTTMRVVIYEDRNPASWGDVTPEEARRAAALLGEWVAAEVRNLWPAATVEIELYDDGIGAHRPTRVYDTDPQDAEVIIRQVERCQQERWTDALQEALDLHNHMTLVETFDTLLADVGENGWLDATPSGVADEVTQAAEDIRDGHRVARPEVRRLAADWLTLPEDTKRRVARALLLEDAILRDERPVP